MRDRDSTPLPPSPTTRAAAKANVVEQIIHREEFRGCFFVNVAMEFPLAHDPAHVAAAANKAAMQEITERLAREAGADEPQTLAKELMLLMEGAYVTRQVTGDAEAARVARDAAGGLIDRRLRTTGQRSSAVTLDPGG